MLRGGTDELGGSRHPSEDGSGRKSAGGEGIKVHIKLNTFQLVIKREYSVFQGEMEEL